MRRAQIIGIMVVGLMAATVRTSPAIGRFVSSAQSVSRNFTCLKRSGVSLNPVERFVFSLLLANTNAQGPADRHT